MKRFDLTQSITNKDSLVTLVYFREIRKYNLLSTDEEVQLINRIREGDTDARNLLITSNLKFVISIAKKYQYVGFTFNDLISEGNFGLFDAIERFDATKGFKFITYAVWWIRQSIVRSILENHKTIRVPAGQYWKNNTIMKLNNNFEQENYRTPTVSETAKIMNMEEFEINSITISNADSISLETAIDLDNDSHLIDVLVNDETPSPDQELLHESLVNEINKSLNLLPEKEAKVIELYFGLNGNDEHSIFSISKKLYLSEERVGQLKDNALKRLRVLPVHSNLRTFLS
ncbi:MAG TPA: RNA polymerase sigma factor RpoD/SigA [Bacteroidales bacterium]|nr:RNA polymerase sigma factor RpoD/SigA [Bacteroidales bacterium]